jgi:hypothetical protein
MLENGAIVNVQKAGVLMSVVREKSVGTSLFVARMRAIIVNVFPCNVPVRNAHMPAKARRGLTRPMLSAQSAPRPNSGGVAVGVFVATTPVLFG